MPGGRLATERSLANSRGMAVASWLAVALLAGGAVTSSAVDDYPIVDAPVPAFGVESVFGDEVAAPYLDDVPIVQDSIAAPWEPVTRFSGPRCCDGVAVPEGW